MMHDSVHDIAGDDPRIAKLLRTSLQRLADGPDGPLREMAEGVLRGHVDLRQAATSEAYGAKLGAGLRRFLAEYQEMDPAERDKLAQRGEDYLDALLDEESSDGSTQGRAEREAGPDLPRG